MAARPATVGLDGHAPVAAPVLSAGVVFGLSGQVPHDKWVGRLEERGQDFRSAAAPVTFPNEFGDPRKNAKTLVLYDSTGAFAQEAEGYGITAANLATHFGTVNAIKAVDYTSHLMDGFDAVIYVGSTYDEPLPAAFLRDVVRGTTPVVWAGMNVWQLAGDTGSNEAQRFQDKYGWRADASPLTSDNKVVAVEYKHHLLDRDWRNTDEILVPNLVDKDKVKVLAKAICGEPSHPVRCRGLGSDSATSMPWAIRSANLTYVGEVPFDYVAEQDRYLIFADLLYGPSSPGHEASPAGRREAGGRRPIGGPRPADPGSRLLARGRSAIPGGRHPDLRGTAR